MTFDVQRPWQRRAELTAQATALLRGDRTKRPRPTQVTEPPAPEPRERMKFEAPEPVVGPRRLTLADLRLHPLARKAGAIK